MGFFAAGAVILRQAPDGGSQWRRCAGIPHARPDGTKPLGMDGWTVRRWRPAACKEPGTQRATPWHQDLPYYCVDGAQTVSLYVSLDEVPAEIAVRFWRKD